MGEGLEVEVGVAGAEAEHDGGRAVASPWGAADLLGGHGGEAEASADADGEAVEVGLVEHDGGERAGAADDVEDLGGELSSRRMAVVSMAVMAVLSVDVGA